MGLAGPRRPHNVVEVAINGQIVRGAYERVSDDILVTTLDSQFRGPLNGQTDEAAARGLLVSAFKAAKK